MHIDWVTLAAQVLNFLILLVLLHRFLYRPVMRVMADREREIAERLDDAEEARQTAEQEAQELEAERKSLVEERQRLLEETRAEVAKERDALLAEARDQVEQRRRRWHSNLDREEEEYAEELTRRVARLVLDSVEHAFEVLASASVQAQIQQQFAARLEEIDGGRRDELNQALADDEDTTAVVRVSTEPDEPAQQELERAVRDLLDESAEIRFEVSDEVFGGVELRIGDHRVGWSFGDYLESLDDDVFRSLREART